MHELSHLIYVSCCLVQGPVNWMENEGSYDPTENPFASKQLKVVEVKFEKFDLRVHKIIMIFSTYGVNIEQIYIQRSVVHSEGNSAIDTCTI